jgi:hypothetical protein
LATSLMVGNGDSSEMVSFELQPIHENDAMVSFS